MRRGLRVRSAQVFAEGPRVTPCCTLPPPEPQGRALRDAILALRLLLERVPRQRRRHPRCSTGSHVKGARVQIQLLAQETGIDAGSDTTRPPWLGRNSASGELMERTMHGCYRALPRTHRGAEFPTGLREMTHTVKRVFFLSLAEMRVSCS